MTVEQNDQKLNRRLHALVVREFESTITAAEHAELESLLLESSVAREMYIQYMHVTAHLRWLCVEEFGDRRESEQVPAEPVELGPSRIRQRLWKAGAIISAIACSLLLASWGGLLDLNSEPRGAQVAETSSPSDLGTSPNPLGAFFPLIERDETISVATVTGLDSARWSQSGEGARLLSRCRIGERWQLLEGRAELTFDSGVLMTVFAPADFDILSPTSVRCYQGRMTALVDERGKGFTIETPQAQVVDLGTQFGVDISADGDTQVVVFQGSVDLNLGATSLLPSGKRTRRLEQGDALLLRNSGELHRVMAVRRDRFLGRLSRFPNRPAVIVDIRDNIRSDRNAKTYQIVHGCFDEDVLCFVDRNHEWNGIDQSGLPEFLIGADYIMPFNDDKFIRNLQVELCLSKPASLYVFLDNNMKIPDWLRRDFVDTGVDIGLDGAATEWHPDDSLSIGAGESIDFTFSVWQRDIQKSGVITLGSVDPPEIGNRSYGFNMYGIAAVAHD